MTALPNACVKCGSDDVLTIRLAPTGRDVNFRTCRHCEHRSWHDGETAPDTSLGLDEVLAKLSAR